MKRERRDFAMALCAVWDCLDDGMGTGVVGFDGDGIISRMGFFPLCLFVCKTEIFDLLLFIPRFLYYDYPHPHL